MNSKQDISSLCRIKVNKMLSSLNSKKNIFIPNYTLLNKNEEKYSYLNKKGNSIKTNHKKNIKDKLNKTNILTTEENYNKQPIDFIINHGVLVYQRNFKGEEVINLGINNEYLRKNNFNMEKKNNTIYQTESNFHHKNNNNNNTVNRYTRQNWSIKRRTNTNGSKKTLGSTSDIPLFKNKNTSSRQKKILSTNLNTTQNSISSVNSFSVKTFLASSKNQKNSSANKNKNENIKNNIINQNTKNTKRVINYVRKKNNNTNSQNKFFIFRKRKKNNSTIIGKEEKANNKTVIKDNKVIPNNINNKYKTNYNSKKNFEKIKNINNEEKKYNSAEQFTNFETIKKLTQLYININKIKKYYLKKYFNILKEYNININPSTNRNRFKEKKISLDIYENQNKLNKIGINKIIQEKSKQNKNFKNSYCNPEHKKSNSILVNKKFSSNTTSAKELLKNNSNSSLTYIISKNMKFFSKEKNDKNEKNSELYRDCKSLQRKYEEICRRKKRQYTMTFTNKFKDNISNNENNNLNKTNSFSNFDCNSVNSFPIKKSDKLNQMFNLNENNNDKKNNTENKKDKNIYKIKLIKNNAHDKKIISYRIEKSNQKTLIDNNFLKQNNLIENDLQKKYNFGSNYKKIEQNINNELNNKFNHKVFIHKRKNYILDDKNKNKEIFYKRRQKRNNSNGTKRGNLSFSIKNICTKDKRISIHINYVPFIPNSKNNYIKSLLIIENIINYNYIPIKKIKNIIKRKNDNKLTLIREEEEKSKYLNSTNNSKIFEDELNSTLKNSTNFRITKNKKIHNLNIIKLVGILHKCFYNNNIYDKKDFIFKLKIIFLVTIIKCIIHNKIKDAHIIKYLKKKSKDKNNVIYYKKKNNIKHISNIYFKDKVYLNNIIINENILSSHSFDLHQKYKDDEKHKDKQNINIYHKNNGDKFNILDYQSKTEIYKFNMDD